MTSLKMDNFKDLLYLNLSCCVSLFGLSIPHVYYSRELVFKLVKRSLGLFISIFVVVHRQLYYYFCNCLFGGGSRNLCDTGKLYFRIL